ncbi:MAG: hypothetical protein IPP15_23905 [Saprospiraceae bacterium]|uniref:Uncharacterized protein n=1 Tax=Candidatus Opimibacter skivensis TaxID=2982028 RepID=A0A9D7XST6_9BACT|nr:hypothetical protein [Candidatus Opimibacter skivensis]
MKATPQYRVQFETVTDPENISQGAIFTNCTIDNGHFVICAPTAPNSAGLAFFGKIKE